MGSQVSKVAYNSKKKQEKIESIPGSRRSSITEFFSKRKQSITSIMKKENDIKEYDRQQREHYLLKLARKGNTWTILNSPQVIVETGIGNGIWTLEMAGQYPQCRLIGLDKKLPDIQLSNQTFHCVNILETWPIENNSVDFIFQRNMISCIQSNQWKTLLKEMFRVVKPGASIELIEPELLQHRPGPVLQAFHVYYKQQCAESNIDIELEKMVDWLEECGFQDIEKKSLDIPIGEWEEEIGMFVKHNV